MVKNKAIGTMGITENVCLLSNEVLAPFTENDLSV
jgi:hypothetical protein